ncbi:MAG TPA: nucleoside monophosphate kinase [Candidatus Saccharimonadales bacterium]|nr:nucleoside monophosphate kinase [Candidatus Saccharimonadales bacterium]
MISILGTPGAGKTTQTKLLAEYLNCPWFSMGELIRQYATGQARQDMLEGKIIDDTITLGILEKALSKIDTKNEECIVEGNPRTLRQAKWWEAKIQDGSFKITGFIHLVASEKVASQRMAKRGRLDDHENVVQERFSEYRANTKQSLEYLREKGYIVHEIDANGTIEDSEKKIHQALGV